MGPLTKLTSGMPLLLVLLSLVVVSHCFSVHSRRDSDGDAIESAGYIHSIDEHRLTGLGGHGLRGRRSARDPHRFVHHDGKRGEASIFHDHDDDTEELAHAGRAGRGLGAAEEGTRTSSSRHKSRRRVTHEEFQAEIPVAKAWPEEFTISFTTKCGHATGFLAYDWGQERQMIFHGPNSTFCAGFGTTDACQMFENPGGTYVYIPSLSQCFLSAEGVGSVPPGWTTNSVYVGTELVPGIGLCRSYAFPPTGHLWYETLVGSLPCVFVFPDPSMTYYFEPDTFVIDTPDEKYFDLPDYCFDGSSASYK